MKSFVEVRLLSPGVPANELKGYLKDFFVPEGDDLVFQSKLPEDASVSDHLKWLHGMLQYERKNFRKLQESGVDCICRIRVRARSVLIEPEALLLMHKCQFRTEISFNP